MSGDCEFIDIVALKRITPDTTVENFGPRISSSFFEAANLLGTLKLKGYIEIHSSVGNSPVTLTERGRNLLKEAEDRSKKDITKIDEAVLSRIKKGIKSPKQIAEILNVSNSAVAYSLYRMYKKGMIDYRIYNGHVEVMLTEDGFEKAPEKNEGDITISRVSENKRSEIRNKVAEELAKEEIVIEKDTKPDPQKMFKSKMEYYIKRYWIKAAIILFIGILLIGAVLLYYIR